MTRVILVAYMSSTWLPKVARVSVIIIGILSVMMKAYCWVPTKNIIEVRQHDLWSRVVTGFNAGADQLSLWVPFLR